MKINRQFKRFIGRQIKDVEDQIEMLAQRKHWSVNIIGFESPGNIIVNHHRLNVYLDQNSVITGFEFG